MEAIKQIVRTPENHKILVKIPRHILEDELVEVIIIGLGKRKTPTLSRKSIRSKLQCMMNFF